MKTLFKILMLVVSLAVADVLFGALVFRVKPEYRTVRDVLMGRTAVIGGQAERVQNSVAAPYLVYMPAPGFTDRQGLLQHNPDGYRGPRVPVARTPGACRILFMGGSTTYGYHVARWEESYPFQVRDVLVRQLGLATGQVEIINAGLPWGTSAEMLTHYHFKFHYYQPDLVVLHTGFNDVQPALRDGYLPDYSHWRAPLYDLRPLPSHSRFLLRSRIVSIGLCVFVLHDLFSGRHLVRAEDQAAPAPWLGDKYASIQGRAGQVADRDLAFTHNLRSVISAIQRDGARVVLMPVRLNPAGSFPSQAYVENADYPKEVARNAAILEALATETGAAFAPLPLEAISPANWTDHCHLNAAGEREKAEHLCGVLAPLAAGILQQTAP